MLSASASTMFVWQNRNHGGKGSNQNKGLLDMYGDGRKGEEEKCQKSQSRPHQRAEAVLHSAIRGGNDKAATEVTLRFDHLLKRGAEPV